MATRIILLLISICQSDGLTYLGGNINWQPSLQKNKQDWIKISVNLNWLADPSEKVLCHQSAKEPYMDITRYITLNNKVSLTNFTKLRCNIVEMDRYIILSVRYQGRYVTKPSETDIRMFGRLNSANPKSKYWMITMVGSGTSGGDRRPIVAAPPLVILCYGSPTPLIQYVQAINLDSSLVQECRWTNSQQECGSRCTTEKQRQTFQLDKNCSLTYWAKTQSDMNALVLGEPQLLTITVESYNSSSATTPVSSTNLQFSVMEVLDKCQGHRLDFSNTIQKWEFFQQRCSFGLQISFNVTSTDTNPTGWEDITMVNGPPSSTLSQHSPNLISSPKRVTYDFEWKPNEDDDGTHPMCFAVTHAGWTKYACSTITSYGTDSTISQPACNGRVNCEADVFCVPQFLTTTTDVISSTSQTITTQQQATATQQQFTAAKQQTTTTRQVERASKILITITWRTPENTQSTTKSTAAYIQPWMIAFPLGLLALLAVIVVLSALLIQKKRKKARSKVKEVDDYVEPDDDYVHNHRPAVQLRKFSLIPEAMPNAIPLPKRSYNALNRTPLRLFPKQN